MQKTLFIFYLIFQALTFPALAESRLDLDLPTEFPENAPIKGTLIISHPPNEKVDVGSFELEGKPIEAKLIKEENIKGNESLALSLYSFSLPPQPVGLHILSGIKVTIQNKIYQTAPRTYQVKAEAGNASKSIRTSKSQASSPPAKTPSATSASPSPTSPLLYLEAFVNGPDLLYPGQRTKVGYRYFFNTNIQTTKEDLPLLNAEGFLKIGDKTITELEEGGLNVQQIEQTIEAIYPGKYSFGPSYIEGKSYRKDFFGRTVLSKELLSSSAPPLTITIKPFPKKNQPLSFNGAIGNFHWTIKLLSSSKIKVGDEISLIAEISGSGNYDSVQLPEFCCQPGISGFFRLNNLPSVGSLVGDAKQFHIKLRPLIPIVKEIPALQFSSFDPDSAKYIISKSQPIPLQVSSLEGSQGGNLNLEQENTIVKDGKSEPPEANEVVISDNYSLERNDLNNLFFGTWWSLLIIPIGLLGVIFQLNFKNFIAKAPEKLALPTSQELFSKAQAAKLGSTEQHSLLSQAFLLRLQEKGLISSSNVSPDQLPNEGEAGKVKYLLTTIQERLYSKKRKIDEHALWKEAMILFESLKSP